MRCPVDGCGLTLEFAGKQSKGKGEIVSSFSDFSRIVSQRRYDLRLTSDALDDAAGLTSRHVQKIEDAGRRAVEEGIKTDNYILALLLDISAEGQFRRHHKAQLGHLIACRSKTFDRRKTSGQTRIPRADTLMLIIQALGGVVSIQWGEPPALTKRLSSKRRLRDAARFETVRP